MSSVGSRLKKLRLEHGYSQSQLAEYLEIDQSNLSKIENDKRNLNSVSAEKIFSLYNCTPEYLLGETDDYDRQKILFKSGRDVDLSVVAKINQLAYHLIILRDLDDNEPDKVKLPRLDASLKRQLGLDEYSPVDIFNLVPQKIHNLTLSWFPMKRNVHGCCYKNGSDSIILINSAHSKGHQNFTLAHELYHLIDDNENSFICSEGYTDIIEQKADDFASKFLISDNALYDFIDSNDIGEWSINDVVKCEQYFQLDHRNFINRLYSEELISGDQFAEFSFNIMYKAGKLGYDTSLYEPTLGNKQYYSVGHIIPLTERLCEKRKMTMGRRKDILLDIFRDDLVDI